MKHYSKVIKSDISSLGAKILCNGEGLEIYQDPGHSTENSKTLAHYNTVKDALSAIQPQDNKDRKIFINFTRGDDLMVHEVLEGVQMMVEGLSLSTNVEFKNLCEPTSPMDRCAGGWFSCSISSRRVQWRNLLIQWRRVDKFMCSHSYSFLSSEGFRKIGK